MVCERKFVAVLTMALMLLALPSAAFQTATPNLGTRQASGCASSLALPSQATSSTTWFSSDTDQKKSLEQLKAQILQLGAALDRGQAYNPTSGAYYASNMEKARETIQTMIKEYPKPATKMEDIEGEWELVLTTVAHGIFRSSPFFLAIQESYERFAEEKEAFGESKANLFFRLHELQTCSWGASKIGRVAQTIRRDDNNQHFLYSEFDTSLFSLTVIPILGWFKLLPTFGGCVITAAKCNSMDDAGRLKMQVDYTTFRQVEGLNGMPLIGEYLWKLKVPVGAIWKLLPWNKGREASCEVNVVYVDDEWRIVEDLSGDLFVYTRPVVSRPLDANV